MNGGLSAQYARARDLQADALDDDIAGVVEEVRSGKLDDTTGDLSAMYARARESQADFHADTIQRIC